MKNKTIVSVVTAGISGIAAAGVVAQPKPNILFIMSNNRIETRNLAAQYPELTPQNKTVWRMEANPGPGCDPKAGKFACCSIRNASVEMK